MRQFRYILGLVVYLALQTTSAFAASPLHLQLEKSWKSYQAAIKAKDFARSKKTWSAHSLRVARNEAVAVKENFPQSFFKAPTPDLPLKQLKRARTAQKGRTASSVYYIKQMLMEQANQAPKLFVSCTVLYFVKEEGRWKFDDLNYGYITPQQLQQMLKGKNIALNGMSILPTGKIKPVPAEIKSPDYIGEMHIRSRRFKTTLNINGHFKIVTDNDERFLVPGGLKRGKNRITITSTPILGSNKGSGPEVSILIYAMKTAQGLWGYGNQGVFTLDTTKAQKGTVKEFNVTEATFPSGI